MTKTGEDRRIVLCPRAIAVIERQLHLRERMVQSDLIDHDHLFFTDSGAPIPDVKYPYVRHRLTTMFSVYAAWTEGALEADIVAIRDAMNRRESTGRGMAQALPETPARPDQPVARPESRQSLQRSDVPLVKANRPRETRFGSRFVSRFTASTAQSSEIKGNVWWKGRDSNPRPRHYECTPPVHHAALDDDRWS